MNEAVSGSSHIFKYISFHYCIFSKNVDVFDYQDGNFLFKDLFIWNFHFLKTHFLKMSEALTGSNYRAQLAVY